MKIETRAEVMRITNTLVDYLRNCDDDEFAEWVETNVRNHHQFLPWEIEGEAEQDEFDAGLREACDFDETDEEEC